MVLLAMAAGEGAPLRAQAQPPAFVDNQLIVRLREGDSPAKLAVLLDELGAVGATMLSSANGLYVIELPEGLGVPTARFIAEQVDAVAYAEPNYIVTTVLQPNDTSFGSLWGLHNTGQTGGSADADIDAPEAWNTTTGSSSVVIAVIDTGTDYTHPDLAANMFRNESDCDGDGVDDDSNGYADDCYGIDSVNNDSNPMDDHGHGTHTAGTIGAVGNNGVGVAGVNWNVKLLPCKFLSASGSGSTAGAITCLQYIAALKDRGVNIVATSNSWGGGPFSQSLYDAIEAQRQRGILFIAAAGNSSSDNDATAQYPANYEVPNVLSVASTTNTDTRSYFSSYGRRTVHLGAPGSSILSTTPGNNYATYSGTSMATPHVAGVAGLLKAQEPSRDWRAIRNLIIAGGDPTADMTGATISGRRLNANGSLSCTSTTLFSQVKPMTNSVVVTTGSSVTVAAFNITCGTPAGNVVAGISTGGSLTLVDDGAGTDQAAGDGVYSGSFTPAAAGTHVLTFPDSSTLTVLSAVDTNYVVQSVPYQYRTITGTNLNLSDDTSATVTSPFPITFAGVQMTAVRVSSNGNVTFSSANNAYSNPSLPTIVVSEVIAPFWDDLYAGLSAGSNVFWAATGTAPNRELVIEWRDIARYGCPSNLTVKFEAVFREGSPIILFNYADTSFGGSCAYADNGASATVGIQVAPGSARLYGYNTASLSDGLALQWKPPGTPDPFTDNPLQARTTAIRAVHITELRARIDVLRRRYGLPSMEWTDSTLVAGATIVRVIHLTELRSALLDAYLAAGVSAPFENPPIASGQVFVLASHLAELRTATEQLEQR